MRNATARQTRRRSPGEGSVYRNGNRWRGALTWTNPDGTRERRVVSGTTAAEARHNLDELRRQARLGPIPSAQLTVGDYLAGWIERDRANVRPSTWRGRESHVRVYLIPSLGRVLMGKLTPADVESALGAFQLQGRPVVGKRGRPQRPISPMTARHIRATLRRALNDAIRDGLIVRNAAREAKPPRVAHRDVTYLAPDLVRRLLDATANAENGPLYAVAASTGLRLGELLGLRWETVDLSTGTLSVRQSLARAHNGGWELSAPKSDKSRRMIPLPSIARVALLAQQERQEAARQAVGEAWQDTAGLVFTDTVGRPLDPHRVSSAFHRDREAASVPRVRFHDLRHSAATLLLAQGVPLLIVSQLLGHSGIAITERHYAGILPDLHREAAAAMDRALEAGT